MRLLTKALTLTATVVTLAAIGGGVAFAGWFATSPEVKAKVRTAAMPGFDTGPAVDVNARKKTVAVRWVAQKVVKGERVQRYIVRRYNTATGVKLTVCGDQVVTAGQMKLRTGAPVKVDNSTVPPNNPAPKPSES